MTFKLGEFCGLCFLAAAAAFETGFQLIQLDVETQFGSVANKVLQLVATNTETVFRMAELAGTRRFRVRLPRVRRPSTQRAVHRHRIREIRLRVAATGRADGPAAASHQVSRCVKHGIGDVLKDVEAEDAAETRDGPVCVEERRRIEFDINLLACSFKESQRMRRAQMR